MNCFHELPAGAVDLWIRLFYLYPFIPAVLVVTNPRCLWFIHTGAHEMNTSCCSVRWYVLSLNYPRNI